MLFFIHQFACNYIGVYIPSLGSQPTGINIVNIIMKINGRSSALFHRFGSRLMMNGVLLNYTNGKYDT